MTARAAVIGVSGFGAIHYADLMRERAAGRVEIVGATIINQAEEVEKCNALRAIGCPVYDDYRKMLTDLRGKLDLCLIPTAIAMHLPMTLAALEAGANVFVEKPVTPTLQEAAVMAAAEKRSGRFVAVGYQAIYQPEIHRIKKLLLSGAIGTPRLFKAYGLWPRTAAYYHRNNWAAKLGSPEHWVLDSPFTNAFAHYLNLLSFYAGNSFAETAEVDTVEAGLFRINPVESCDTAAITVTTRDQKRLQLHVTHCSEENIDPVGCIIGDRGSIEYSLRKNIVRDIDGAIVDEFDSTTPDSAVRRHIFDALLARLHDPQSFICTIEIAAKHTLISNAIFDSASIHTLPPEAYRITMRDQAEYRYIPGIDNAIRRAFRENRQLNTQDYPWAVSSKPFSVANYQSFSGNLIQK